MQPTCSHCGEALAPGVSVCPSCGTPVTANTLPQQGSGPSGAQTTNVPETIYGAAQASTAPAPYASQQRPGAVVVAAPGTPGGPRRPSQPRQKRSPALLILLGALVVLLVALLSATGVVLIKNQKNANATTHTPTPTPTSPGGIPSLYQASLTSDPGSWQCTTAKTCSFSKDGYHIKGFENGFISDSLLIKQTFTDMVIEVKAVIVQGDTENAGIGIEFRVPEQSEAAGYGFMVYDDGTFDVQKWDAQGNSSDLVGTTPSSLIPRGLNQLNDLKIVIEGTQFTFYDNGQQIATASDATYSSGYIGLAAAEQGTEGIFTDLLITNPPAAA